MKSLIYVKALVSLFFLGAFVNLSVGQALNAPVYTPAQLSADLDELVKNVEEIHPDCYAYTSKETITRFADSLKRTIKQPLTAVEFYRHVVVLLARYNDPSTLALFPMNYYMSSLPLNFPYDLGVDVEKFTLHVTADYSREQGVIPLGSRILSINGIQTKDIIQTLQKSVGSPGSKAQQSLLIESNFAQLLWAFYGFNKSYLLEFAEKNLKEKAIIPGVPINDLINRGRNTTVEKDYTYTVLSEFSKAGVIDIRNFVYRNRFSVFLRRAFADFNQKGVQYLIIDLRNAAGNDTYLVDSLLQYISPVPYTLFQKIETKHSKQQVDVYTDERDYRFPGYTNEEFDAVLLKNLKYGELAVQIPEPEPLKNNQNRFAGKVYILVSNKTGLAGNVLAWSARQYNVATLVGEAPVQPPVFFSDVLEQMLSNSQLGYAVPHKKYYLYGVTDENSTLTIDWPVEVGIDALTYTLNQIK